MICSVKEGFKILGTTWQRTMKKIQEPRVLGFIIVQGITRPWTLNPFKQQQQQQVLRFSNDFQAGFKILLLLLLTWFRECKSQQPKPLLLACCEPFKEEGLQLSRHCRITDCNQAMISNLDQVKNSTTLTRELPALTMIFRSRCPKQKFQIRIWWFAVLDAAEQRRISQGGGGSKVDYIVN